MVCPDNNVFLIILLEKRQLKGQEDGLVDKAPTWYDSWVWITGTLKFLEMFDNLTVIPTHWCQRQNVCGKLAKMAS